MKMYSISQIKKLQVDEDYYSAESNKYCLTQNFIKDNLTFQDVENHCNFCILRILNDYKNGMTPNPCILCNREVKFNFLYKCMLDYNCDHIATGHYAKIKNGKLYLILQN